MPGMTTFSGQKPVGHGMGRRILESKMPVPPEAMAGALSRSGAGSRLRAKGRGHASRRGVDTRAGTGAGGDALGFPGPCCMATISTA